MDEPPPVRRFLCASERETQGDRHARLRPSCRCPAACCI